ncbi:MAG: hypothetical protein JWN41_832 [Thermoleophilia bacterium]|nr:hypothetical protein [Thermoleophilia bacterium]
MRELLPMSRRALRWAVGTPIEVWRYATRRVPVLRSEIAYADVDIEVTPLPSTLAKGVRPLSAGVGPAFHRTYAVRIAKATCTPEELLLSLERNFSEAAPGGITEVDEPSPPQGYAVGDQLNIHLAGPWDAPVRVIDVGPSHFRFATLDGHMESGEIEFRVAGTSEPGEIEVTIESWARSSDRVFAALYHPLGLAKEIQLHMWSTVLERLAQRSGGTIVDGIRVITRRREGVDA